MENILNLRILYPNIWLSPLGGGRGGVIVPPAAVELEMPAEEVLS